jgi:single-strand DNA-binding protein
MLEGRLVLEQWTANDGTNRNKHSLRVDNFKFLDSKADSQNNMGGGNYQPQNGGYNQQPQEQQSYGGQPSYNQQNNNMQQGGMNSGYQAPQQNIPEINIDIDEDEIPF